MFLRDIKDKAGKASPALAPKHARRVSATSLQMKCEGIHHGI